MKRLVVLLTLCVLLAGVFCLPVSAETAATQVDLQCTVTSEGDCLVTATVNLRLEAALDKLTYPVPLDAKNITVNGSNAAATHYASALQVDLSRISKGYVGEASVRIGYTLPGAVKIATLNQAAVDAGKEKPNRALLLTVPLLSGFEYPVEAMNFTITMPSNCVGLSPSFTSIYRQESIESDLKILPITGSQIIGSTKAVMNDREGVTMTMVVPDKMFPTVSTYVRDGYPELPYILGFFGAALLYWLLTLRTWPIHRSRASTAPEGITAGELDCSTLDGLLATEGVEHLADGIEIRLVDVSRIVRIGETDGTVHVAPVGEVDVRQCGRGEHLHLLAVDDDVDVLSVLQVLVHGVLQSGPVLGVLLRLEIFGGIGPIYIAELSVLGALLLHEDFPILLEDGGFQDLAALGTDRLGLLGKTCGRRVGLNCCAHKGWNLSLY